MAFSDRDHLWFEASRKCISNGSSESQTVRSEDNLGEDDPMAAMLENNVKNTTNIFINQLHSLSNGTSNCVMPEYAEVDGLKMMASSENMSNSRLAMSTRQLEQGPYATTTLVEPNQPASNAVRTTYFSSIIKKHLTKNRYCVLKIQVILEKYILLFKFHNSSNKLNEQSATLTWIKSNQRGPNLIKRIVAFNYYH